MDVLDRAQELEEKQRDIALKHARRQNTLSLSECKDCDADIPPARQAVGGVTRCVGCQSLHEKKQKRYG